MYMTGLQVDFDQPDLIDAFLWDKSPQGFHYWERVNDLIECEKRRRIQEGRKKFKQTIAEKTA